MKIYLAQISPKISKENTDTHIRLIKEAIKKGADTIAFPELSLNGYKMMDSVVENSYRPAELNLFKELSQKIDIILGVALREENAIYNAALYFSKNSLLHIHKKNILPNYLMFEEARFFFKGEEILSFETKFGKTVTIICEDLWSSSSIEKLSKLSPDLIYVLANSPARDFEESGLLIEQKWDALLKTASILNGAYTIFINRVGFEDGMGFWGGSRIISPDARVLYSMERYEEAFELLTLDMQITKNQKYLLRNR